MLTRPADSRRSFQNYRLVRRSVILIDTNESNPSGRQVICALYPWIMHTALSRFVLCNPWRLGKLQHQWHWMKCSSMFENTLYQNKTHKKESTKCVPSCYDIGSTSEIYQIYGFMLHIVGKIICPKKIMSRKWLRCLVSYLEVHGMRVISVHFNVSYRIL